MAEPTHLRCDGCGQPASAEHVARRLQRLEWSTRFRPVHIGTLLLGSFSPEKESEFLYAPASQWQGEARMVLEAAGIATHGKSVEAVLSEFQRAGFFLTHVLECPIDAGSQPAPSTIANRLPAAMARIRRSLRPKRLVATSGLLVDAIPVLLAGDLGCAVALDDGRPFALEQGGSQLARLRELLSTPGAGALSAS